MTALYSHTTRSTGTTLTAVIYNFDHQNHIDNGIPAQLDDYSTNATEMQSTVSPGTVGGESLATTLAGELERLRYVLKTMHAGAQWYPGVALVPAAAPTITGTAVFSGTIDSTGTTDSTSISTGAIQTDGGLGVTKALWVGGLANIAGAVTLQGALIGDATIDSTSISTGAFQTDGGLGVTKALWVGGLANIAGAVTLQGALIGDATTDSTSISTGAFQTDGGLGVTKALWVGGLLNVAGNTTLQGTLTLTTPLTYVDTAVDATDTTSYTFTGASVGTAAYQRHIHVVVHAMGGTPDITACTIGGFAATLNKSAVNSLGAVAIFTARLDYDTTADIVVTVPGGALACGIAVYNSVGLSSPDARDAGSSTADPGTDTLATRNGGFAIGGATRNATETWTWTNVTENYETTAEATRSMGGGSVDNTTAGTLAITADYATSSANGCAVFATF